METKENPTHSPYPSKPNNNFGQWMSIAIKGAFVGVGGILPGVSGGVLCVAFGLYKPLMEVLANPFTGIKKHLSLLIPFGVGGGLGFISLAGLIGALLQAESTLVISAFVGLILGVFPALFREAGQEGRSKQDWVALGCSTLFLTTFFMVLKTSQAVNITLDLWWYVFSGALFGIGVIVPGMSSSSLLIFLGLYEPMTSGIGAFDLEVIIPVGCGVVATVLLLARGVQKLFLNHYARTFHCIVGFVIASTIPIVPTEFVSTMELMQSIACAAGGFIFAYGMDKWGETVRPVGGSSGDSAPDAPLPSEGGESLPSDMAPVEWALEENKACPEDSAEETKDGSS